MSSSKKSDDRGGYLSNRVSPGRKPAKISLASESNEKRKRRVRFNDVLCRDMVSHGWKRKETNKVYLTFLYFPPSCSTPWSRSTTSTRGPPPWGWSPPPTWSPSSSSRWWWRWRPASSSPWATPASVSSVSWSPSPSWAASLSWLSPYFYRGKAPDCPDWRSEFDYLTSTVTFLHWPERF